MDDSVRRLLRARRSLPLWARWLIAIVVYVVGIAIVVAIVHGLAGESESGNEKTEASAVAEANKEGKIAIAQDQAPHSATRPDGLSVVAALEGAIGADVKRRIAHGELTGPLRKGHCASSGAASGMQAFRCVVVSAGIGYEFDAVADQATGQLVWCKLDKAPEGDAALEVPVSARCLR